MTDEISREANIHAKYYQLWARSRRRLIILGIGTLSSLGPYRTSALIDT